MPLAGQPAGTELAPTSAALLLYSLIEKWGRGAPVAAEIFRLHHWVFLMLFSMVLACLFMVLFMVLACLFMGMSICLACLSLVLF